MSDEFDELRRSYRNIKAPPYLATRIRAAVSDRRVRSRSWMPAGATLMVIVAAAWLLPFSMQYPQGPASKPTKPSLSALASLKPDKPAVKAPSLAQLRSVKVPQLPAKPVVKPAKPQSNLHFENDILKEKDHAHT